MNINEAISYVADLLVYAAQADGIEDHEIEAHCNDRRIAEIAEGLGVMPSGSAARGAFCSDVRDAIATIVG